MSNVDFVAQKDRMLRIQRSENGEVVFKLSGRMDEEAIGELERLVNSEEKGRCIVLDLKDLSLVDEDAIRFLVGCEANSITLRNCRAYVREWIKVQRGES
jgi:anti-anti-sigma regulatory factor